jgi:hypothetical protein
LPISVTIDRVLGRVQAADRAHERLHDRLVLAERGGASG